MDENRAKFRHLRRRYDRRARILLGHIAGGELIVQVYERLEFSEMKYRPGSIARVHRDPKRQTVLEVYEPI